LQSRRSLQIIRWLTSPAQDSYDHSSPFMAFTAPDILGPDGRIAARLPRYEQRPEQLQMAAAVTEAIRAREHLLVEAGTGDLGRVPGSA
jgi:hypothetical protein